MAEVETLRISIEADPRSLDTAIKGLDRSITSLSKKLDKESAALNVRLGTLSETIGEFRSQTDGAANAIGRLVEGLGKLSGLRPVEGFGQVLSGVDLGRSAFESRFARRFGQDPAALRDEFLILNKRLATLEGLNEEERAVRGLNREVADFRAKQREIAGTLAALASKIAADLRNAAGSEPGLPDTGAVQELRRRFNDLVAIMEELGSATSDPRIKSIFEGVRSSSKVRPEQTGAVDAPARNPRRLQLASADTSFVPAIAGETAALREAEDTLSAAVERSSGALNEQAGAVGRLDTATRDLGFTFASAFEDAVVEGRRLSDVLDGLERDILRILTRKLVTEPLAGAVTGLVGSGVGALAGEFHGGGTVGSTSVSGRVVPTSLFAGAPRFAGGGLVARVPRLAPGEVPAILHRGEVVRTPAQEAALRRSAGGSGETRIVVNIQTPDPRAFNESRGQIQALLADAVRAGRRNR